MYDWHVLGVGARDGIEKAELANAKSRYNRRYTLDSCVSIRSIAFWNMSWAF